MNNFEVFFFCDNLILSSDKISLFSYSLKSVIISFKQDDSKILNLFSSK